MSWTTGVSDLRTILSDGPTDRYNFRKRCFGEVNGTNARFKTFEFRRITNFTLTQGVYVDGVLQPTVNISSDSPDTGEFIFVSGSIPVDGDIVEASYYTQWFIDSELTSFLGYAAQWLLSTTDFTTVPDGLQPCALHYASSEAYKKMAQKWRILQSDMFKVEDAPEEQASGRVDSFIKMAEFYREEALKLRNEFYKRQGRSLQPLFGSISGRVRQFP